MTATGTRKSVTERGALVEIGTIDAVGGLLLYPSCLNCALIIYIQDSQRKVTSFGIDRVRHFGMVRGIGPGHPPIGVPEQIERTIAEKAGLTKERGIQTVELTHIIYLRPVTEIRWMWIPLRLTGKKNWRS